MKPTHNTEEFVRNGKPRITTGSQMDKKILKDSFAAMERTLGTDNSRVCRPVLLNRTIRLAAAAAVMIVAATLLMVYKGPKEEQPRQRVAVYDKEPPVKMLSMISLNMAYRRGGLDALDHQSSKALETLGSQSDTVSIQELLAETNGV